MLLATRVSAGGTDPPSRRAQLGEGCSFHKAAARWATRVRRRGVSHSESRRTAACPASPPRLDRSISLVRTRHCDGARSFHVGGAAVHGARHHNSFHRATISTTGECYRTRTRSRASSVCPRHGSSVWRRLPERKGARRNLEELTAISERCRAQRARRGSGDTATYTRTLHRLSNTMIWLRSRIPRLRAAAGDPSQRLEDAVQLPTDRRAHGEGSWARDSFGRIMTTNGLWPSRSSQRRSWTAENRTEELTASRTSALGGPEANADLAYHHAKGRGKPYSMAREVMGTFSVFSRRCTAVRPRPSLRRRKLAADGRRAHRP